MKSTPRLYDTLIGILGQHKHWRDKRHFQTLAWMVVGLLESGLISLTAWAPFVEGRALFAQSIVRRFRRWLDNERIQVHDYYAPLIREALSDWGEQVLYLAFDTSQLWGRFCIIRLALVYRGRAVPLVWRVIEHSSSSVAFETYRPLLDQAQALIPPGGQVVFLADRGFADTDLMAYLRDSLHWHWRIRIKSSFLVYRPGQRRIKISSITLQRGQARFWHSVYITADRFGPVHLALAKPHGLPEEWLMVSDQPADVTTFDEYGLRFDIEETFLDDKSNGFQLESSLVRSAEALSRLCLALALATLFLVCQGTQVVASGQRRWVDPHWFRGSSYFKIGWRWVQRALVMGYALITRLRLSPVLDPDPAIASQKQAQARSPLRFAAVHVEVFPPYAASSP